MSAFGRCGGACHPPLGYHEEFARIFGFRTFITNANDIVRESDHVQVERFAEEVERCGDDAIQLGVSWELDMKRYIDNGRWCYVPLLAVSTVF